MRTLLPGELSEPARLMVPAEEPEADFGREERWLCLDRAAVPGLPVAETAALLPCIMASALVTGSRRTAAVDHARLLQPYDGSSWTRCGHSHFMRKWQGRGCRRPDWKMFCSTSCGRRPGVRFGSLDRLCECGFPSCCATAIQVPLRGATTSIAWDSRMRCASIGVGVIFSWSKSGVRASRMRVGWVDGWVWVGRLVSSRLASYAGVLSRVVSSGAES